MRKILFLGLFLFSWVLAAQARADVKVAATIPNLAALAEAVGGKHVTVKSLSLPTQDPHFVDARPSLALDLNKAGLLVAAGLQLESGWLPVLQRGARNAAIQPGGKGFLDCSTVVQLKEISGNTDRAAGDIHPGGNPHYLTDPQNAKRCANAIAERLAQLDPPNAAAFRTNADAFAARLDQKVAAWRTQMQPVAGTPVVVYHRSWIYLLDWLKLREVGSIEPKPGIPPNPAHVAQLLQTMRREKARLILQESFYPDATAHLLAEKTGAKVVEIAGGPAAGGDYIAWMETLLQAIGKAAQP